MQHEYTCIHCGLTFPPRRAKPNRFCSPSCSIAWQRAESIATAPARFWSRVKKTDSCWLWTGGHLPTGYGRFDYNGKQVFAHRWAFEQSYGQVLPGIIICHHCDNPSCIRPDHLFAGTHADNVHDSMKKGRWAAPHSACTHKHRRPAKTTKLTDDRVREIRQRHTTGTTSFRKLAAEFGVARATIAKAICRQTWQDVVD